MLFAILAVLSIVSGSPILPIDAPTQREAIDRIVAIVDNHIITLSDIRTEKVIREILGEPMPEDDRDVLGELIDQHLIRAQLDRYPRAEPSDAELDEGLSQIKDAHGLPPETVRAAVRDHLRVQRFFAERFGQFISTTEGEIQKYYDEVFVPAALARGLIPVPVLAGVHDDIRRNIEQEKLAGQVNKWIQDTKRITKIEIFNY